jgi:uncharacterized protein YeaO (DUF488 family)
LLSSWIAQRNGHRDSSPAFDPPAGMVTLRRVLGFTDEDRAMAQTDIKVLRVYDDDGRATGYRVLVDRLWPRGIKKDELQMDAWEKDLAPSTALRRWYGHDPEKFLEFSRRYALELNSASGVEAIARIRKAAGRHGLLLLTSTRDVAHSGAEVLRALLTSTREQHR